MQWKKKLSFTNIHSRETITLLQTIPFSHSLIYSLYFYSCTAVNQFNTRSTQLLQNQTTAFGFVSVNENTVL